jgi:hypothetical protein
MQTAGTLTLVDEVTDETVTTDAGLTTAACIDRRVADVDLPRADFRGRPLEIQLVADDGSALPADRVLAAGQTVRLTSPDAGEVIARRDRWLADIEAGGAQPASVATGTQLALVERTGSRLDDVARLRAALAAQRRPPPSSASRWLRPLSTWRARLGGVVLTALVLLLVGAIFAAWASWFIDDLGSGAATGVNDGGSVQTIVVGRVVDEPAELAAREEQLDALISEAPPPVGPGGIPGQGCGVLDMGDVDPPVDLEVQLSCETAVLTIDVVGDDGDDGGATLDISARSGSGDPVVWLFDEEGQEIGFNDDTASLDSSLVVDVVAGRYEVHVGNLMGEPSPIQVAIEMG